MNISQKVTRNLHPIERLFYINQCYRRNENYVSVNLLIEIYFSLLINVNK